MFSRHHISWNEWKSWIIWDARYQRFLGLHWAARVFEPPGFSRLQRVRQYHEIDHQSATGGLLHPSTALATSVALFLRPPVQYANVGAAWQLRQVSWYQHNRLHLTPGRSSGPALIQTTAGHLHVEIGGKKTPVFYGLTEVRLGEAKFFRGRKKIKK